MFYALNRKTLFVLLLASVCALGTACADAASGTTEGDGDVTMAADVSESVDGTGAADATPGMDGAELPSGDAVAQVDTTMEPLSDVEGPGPSSDVVIPPDNEASWSYPEGPYGKNKFDTIADLTFFDPWENRWVYLHEFHMDPSKKMLILIAGAGWCSACRLEAEHLVDYYDEYEADGLGILYTLYEDNGAKKVFIPGEPATSDMAFMNDWKNLYGVDYPLVADVGFTLEPYFTDNSTPLTMVIRTEDMMIKYVDQGYSSTFLDYQILMNLYN